jgi:hypothetical protein
MPTFDHRFEGAAQDSRDAVPPVHRVPGTASGLRNSAGKEGGRFRHPPPWSCPPPTSTIGHPSNANRNFSPADLMAKRCAIESHLDVSRNRLRAAPFPGDFHNADALISISR